MDITAFRGRKRRERREEESCVANCRSGDKRMDKGGRKIEGGDCLRLKA